MDLGEMSQHFEDLDALALYLLDEDNDSPGFVAFREFLDVFPGEDREKLYEMACEMAKDHDLDCIITVLTFGVEPLLRAAQGLKNRKGLQDV